MIKLILQINFINLLIPIFLAFREGLEATLVVVIILLYLKNTNQQYYNKYVYIGSILAIISSIIFAIIFTAFLGGFTGTPFEGVFEGFTFILSGVFIITLIIWMSKEGPKMKEHLEDKVEKSIQKDKGFTITILAFVIIIREGIELVLMLTGVTAVGSLNQVDIILGSLIGLGIAVIIGLLMLFGIKTINLSKFFKITNVILILFAAGLITYGFHELIEVGLVNPVIEEVWNIKHILPETYPDNNLATPEWLEVIGSLLRALFGYNANPSLLEIIIYPILLISISLISFGLWTKNQKSIE